jgi:hypothetical protein
MNFIKKFLGIDQIEAQLQERMDEIERAKAQLDKKEAAHQAEPVSAKEQATLNKEPYIAVLNTHVNPENIRTGFLELDWNDYFILQLKNNGYEGSTEEEIVDVWFQELCRNIGESQKIDMSKRSSGYVNINNIGNGKSEIG